METNIAWWINFQTNSFLVDILFSSTPCLWCCASVILFSGWKCSLRHFYFFILNRFWVAGMCLEKRVFYRVVSGLHASINLHLCANYLLSGRISLHHFFRISHIISISIINAHFSRFWRKPLKEDLSHTSTFSALFCKM